MATGRQAGMQRLTETETATALQINCKKCALWRFAISLYLNFFLFFYIQFFIVFCLFFGFFGILRCTKFA